MKGELNGKMLTGTVHGKQTLEGEGFPRGNDGISPIVEVSETETGHTVAITDVYGTRAFDVKDGYTPQKGIDYFDGYTPVKGVDYKDGDKGDPGDDYVLTEADKNEIAEMAAAMVDAPEAGGNVDLTGYATEQFVRDGFQPKGEYLTAVPDGYAKTKDIPTKPEDIGAQPVGDYLTEVPSGYATEEFVTNKIAEAELGGEEVDLSGYAQKSELPTKVSQLENDSGYLTGYTETDPTVPAWAKAEKKPTYTAAEVGALPADTEIPVVPTKVSAFTNDAGYLTEHQDISGKLDASALPTAINTALAQAKASGEFDGSDGKDGADGVSATHSWNGTTLTVTSASGTSSADLKGDKGDTGATGADGVGIASIKQTTTSTADGGNNVFTVTLDNGTSATFTVKNGSKGSTGGTGADGANGTSVTVKSVSESSADGGSNVVTFSDGKTLTVKNGKTGAAGADGQPGSPGADGYTPVKGVDYWTEDEQTAIQDECNSYIATELAKRGQLVPEYADSIEKCTDTTKLYVLPDGYIYAYMLTEKEVSTGGYTNLLPLATDTDRKTIYGEDYDGDGDNDGYLKGQRLSSSGGLSALASAGVSGFIPAYEGNVLRIKNVKPIPTSTSAYVITYNSSNTKVQYKSLGTTSDFSDWATPASTPYVTYKDGVLTIPLTSEYFGTGFNAIRFSAGTIDETSIVTINEEIVEGGGTEIVTEYAWVSTGLAFVPADYEHRFDIFDYAYIKNGELVANELDVSGTQHGHYTGVKMDGNIKKIMCKAHIVPNSSVVLISTKLGSSVVANIVRGSIHLIFNSSGCSVGIYDSGVGTLRNVVQYACSTAEDTEVAFGYAVDESTNTMTVYLPDGTTQTLTDDAISTVNGQYAIWEHYCNSASAGFKCCRMTKLWCEDADGNVLDDDMKRLDGAIGVAPTGQVYRQFRTGHQTNRDFA